MNRYRNLSFKQEALRLNDYDKLPPPSVHNGLQVEPFQEACPVAHVYAAPSGVAEDYN